MRVSGSFRPLVTVEAYSKWYGLQLLLAVDHEVLEIPFDNLELTAALSDVPACIDHVPNPEVVVDYASRRGWRVDSRALKEIRERWETHER